MAYRFAFFWAHTQLICKTDSLPLGKTDPAMNPTMPVWPQRALTAFTPASALLQSIRGVFTAQSLPPKKENLLPEDLSPQMAQMCLAKDPGLVDG